MIPLASGKTESVQLMSNTPINVLHFICSTGFYGAEKWILALANNLDRSEVNSELVVTKEWATHDLRLTEEFRSLGLEAHELPMKGRFDVRVIADLVKLIKERNIDVLHSHGYKSDILGLIAAKIAKIKCVSTPHGFEKLDDWKLNQFIKVGCWSMKYFDSVVPLSIELCNDVRKFNVPENKISYIRNGVDLTAIDFRLPSEARQKRAETATPGASAALPRTIGFIGQLIGRKNVPDILDVFDSIASDHPEIRLVFLGDGNARADCEEYAGKLASSGQIEFLGFNNTPLEYLTTFDLFVMTSTLEGIPRCLMESMAMGVPVAAYDIPGVDQLIESGKTGLLAQLGDKETLEGHWRELLWNDESADRISQAAADLVNEKFSAHRMATEYSAHYSDMLKKT